MGISPVSGWPYLLSYIKARSKEVRPIRLYRLFGHTVLSLDDQGKLRALLQLNFTQRYIDENFDGNAIWSAEQYYLPLL